jgi:hypothetical protein
MPKDYEVLENGLIAKPKGDSVRLFSFDIANEELAFEDFSNDDIETLYGLVRHRFDDGFFVVDTNKAIGLARYKSNAEVSLFIGRQLDLVVLECTISEELFDRLHVCCRPNGRIIFGPGGRVIPKDDK